MLFQLEARARNQASKFRASNFGSSVLWVYQKRLNTDIMPVTKGTSGWGTHFMKNKKDSHSGLLDQKRNNNGLCFPAPD